MRLATPRTILDGTVRVLFEGREHGDASPRSERAAARILAAARRLDVARVVVPSLAFRHAVRHAAAAAPGWRGHERIAHIDSAGDGVYIGPERAATDGVYIANGDCPVGVLVGDRDAVVMHLGLACLHRDDGPSLMAQAVARLRAAGVRREALRFWVGCGIGPCCFAYDHSEPAHRQRGARLRALFGDDVLPGPATRGPRAGQQGYDPVLMAMRSAEQLGIPEIRADRQCTSCAGLDDDGGRPLYYSNVRDLQGSRARNLVLVALAGPKA